MISSPSAFYLFFLHYQHFPTSPPDTLDTLDWVLTIHIRAGDHKWCMSYTAAQYFMSYVPKGSGISCRLWNRGFPSSIIMQSLGLTERSLSSISLTIAFDLSVFARKPSATCRPMLYGTGVSGYSVSLQRSTFLFESVTLQEAERPHFPLLVFDCLFYRLAHRSQQKRITYKTWWHSVYQMSKINLTFQPKMAALNEKHLSKNQIRKIHC